MKLKQWQNIFLDSKCKFDSTTYHSNQGWNTCYYFDDIIKLEDLNIDNILIDKKTRENVLISNI